MKLNPKIKKLILNYLVPFLLIAGWVFFVFYKAFIIEHVISIVTEAYSSASLVEKPSDRLLQGEKIVGQFTATYDHLGIIGFRFWNYNQINKDRVIFRIKQQGAAEWHYVYQYATDQFPANGYFTFGFPIIDDSKDKTYTFEIESMAGTMEDSVGPSKQNPMFIAKYQYPKQLITSSPYAFASFAVLKLHNLIKNSEFTSFIYIYLLPAILYILYILGPGKSLTRTFGWQFRDVIFKVRIFLFVNKIGLSHILILSGFLVDIFFVKTGDLTLSILILMFLGIWWVYKRSFDELFVLAVTALILGIVVYYLGETAIAERAGSWVWIFLAVWVINNFRLLFFAEHVKRGIAER